jgi:hypothetical protein
LQSVSHPKIFNFHWLNIRRSSAVVPADDSNVLALRFVTNSGQVKTWALVDIKEESDDTEIFATLAVHDASASKAELEARAAKEQTAMRNEH